MQEAVIHNISLTLFPSYSINNETISNWEKILIYITMNKTKIINREEIWINS